MRAAHLEPLPATYSAAGWLPNTEMARLIYELTTGVESGSHDFAIQSEGPSGALEDLEVNL